MLGVLIFLPSLRITRQPFVRAILISLDPLDYLLRIYPFLFHDDKRTRKRCEKRKLAAYLGRCNDPCNDERPANTQRRTGERKPRDTRDPGSEEEEETVALQRLYGSNVVESFVVRPRFLQCIWTAASDDTAQAAPRAN